MTLTSPKWVIKPGITIGMKMEAVKAKFGQPNNVVESDEEILDYAAKDSSGGVFFHFRNNKLIKAELMQVLC